MVESMAAKTGGTEASKTGIKGGMEGKTGESEASKMTAFKAGTPSEASPKLTVEKLKAKGFSDPAINKTLQNQWNMSQAEAAKVIAN